MEDASKATAKPQLGDAQDSADKPATPDRPEASSSFVAYMDDAAPAAPVTPQKESASTSAKALDRWFAERKKHLGPPRLLEIPNEGMVTSAGPINLTGNITLVSEDGSVTYANHISLCRCGASRNKPTCDNHHLEVEFLNSGRIQEASDAQHSERPCKITISCIKDGPLSFRGKLRLHNTIGQECVKQRGSLCRCGHSANKPFCDGSHEKVGFRSGR
ncbi:MAG TPA: CDGSH iron-sulfur domain-containing protein [Xanthomonadales bacterium]|nr:CDGSH iron-sulfur domain-containing protein [Xanthomonadales bacterium]